jgi:negative regulator of sigma E activity
MIFESSMSREVLSAAVDDAATAAEWDALMDAVASDPAAKAEWTRLWAWRDARDGVAVAAKQPQVDFCIGVMAAITAEALPQENSKVVHLADHRTALLDMGRPSLASRPAGRRLRTIIPVSAAAGIVAAVLTVNFMRSPAPAESQAATAATEQAPTRLAATSSVSTEDAARRAAILNDYVMEHSNTLAERGMGGSLANARFAARTADYRPDAE